MKLSSRSAAAAIALTIGCTSASAFDADRYAKARQAALEEIERTG